MHGYAYRPGLVGYGAGYGLTYPPGGVSRELVALGVVEFVHGLYEAKVALLYQIQEEHAAANIALGYGDDETEVGFGHAALGLFVAVGHALGQLLLLIVPMEGGIGLRIQVQGTLYGLGDLGKLRVSGICRQRCRKGGAHQQYRSKKQREHLFHILTSIFFCSFDDAFIVPQVKTKIKCRCAPSQKNICRKQGIKVYTKEKNRGLQNMPSVVHLFRIDSGRRCHCPFSPRLWALLNIS